MLKIFPFFFLNFCRFFFLTLQECACWVCAQMANTNVESSYGVEATWGKRPDRKFVCMRRNTKGNRKNQHTEGFTYLCQFMRSLLHRFFFLFFLSPKSPSSWLATPPFLQTQGFFNPFNMISSLERWSVFHLMGTWAATRESRLPSALAK